MSDLINYKSLREAVLNYIDREDVTEQIPLFVAMTTRSASKNIELPSQVVGQIVDVKANGDVLIPQDLSVLKSIDWLTYEDTGETDIGGFPLLNIFNRTGLKIKSLYEYKKSIEQYATSSVATPQYFARDGVYYKLFPLPQATEVSSSGEIASNEYVGMVSIRYYQMPTPLANDEDTNWLLDLAPELYLFGTLARAFEYTRDYETAAFWETRYANSLSELQAWSARADESGGTINVGYMS